MEKKHKSFEDLTNEEKTKYLNLHLNEQFDKVSAIIEKPLFEEDFLKYNKGLSELMDNYSKEYYLRNIYPEYIPFKVVLIKDNLKDKVSVKTKKIISISKLHDTPIEIVNTEIRNLKINIIQNISFGCIWYSEGMSKTNINHWFIEPDFADFIEHIEIIEQLESHIDKQESDFLEAANMAKFESAIAIIDKTIGKDLKPEDTTRLKEYIKSLVIDCEVSTNIVPIKITTLKAEDIFSFMYQIWQKKYHTTKSGWKKHCCLFVYKVFSINFDWSIIDEENFDSHTIYKKLASRGKYTPS